MLDRARTFSFEDFCLGALLLASATALVQSLGNPSWWLALPCVPAMLFRLTRLSPPAAKRAVRAGQLLILATTLFGLAWTLYPVMPDNLVRLAPKLLGAGLVSLASIFYMGPLVWSRFHTFLPTSLALLALDAFNPDARIDPAMIVGVASVFLYFASGRAPRLVVYGLISVALGFGIVRFLPWAQPKVEAASVGFLADSAGQTGLSFSDTARLGEVESLASSETVALRVWSTEAQKLRARVLTRFDGAAWHARGGAKKAADLDRADAVPANAAAWLETLPGKTYVVPGRAADEAGGARAVRSKIVVAIASPVLLSPAGALLVRTPVAPARFDAAGILTTSGQTSIYGIVNAALDSTAGREALDDLLLVPPDTDPRLRSLARALGEGAAPEARAQRTLAHLARECRYSLKVGHFQTPQPVAEFLFDKKRGYCEYFASAAALLLRLQGVPTRFVTGFNVTPASYAGGHYVVRESDAHAWIDAYFEDRGWVELDPTPADQYAELHAPSRPGTLAAAWEWLHSQGAEVIALLRSGDLAVLGRRAVLPVALGLALAALVAWRRRRSARPRQDARPEATGLPPELTELLVQVDRDWTRAGWPRPAAQAPLEHLDAIPAERLPLPLQQASRAAVEYYYRVRFAGAPLATSELAALRETLAASRRSLRG